MEDLLATRERLASRLPEPIETPEEIALADEMLSDASADARLYGNQMWTAETVPSGVVNIVLRAAARGYMNPAGFSDEAADSTRFSRDSAYSQGAAFTQAEIQAVKRAAKRHGVAYVQTTRPNAWRSRSDAKRDGTVYVPFEVGGRPFPYLYLGRDA